jgi:dihydroflavonol-4-reductase
MKIALTGATGFLGSTLLPLLLEAGHDVCALARQPSAVPAHPRMKIVAGDLLEEAAVTRLLEGADALIHLAGRVSRDPHDGPALYRLHVAGTRLLLQKAVEAGVTRVVLASTSGTVGVSTTARTATEADDYPITVVGRWPYYLSKIYQEKLALSFCADKGLFLVCLNPSLMLGPGDARFSSVGDVWKFLHRDIPAMPSGGLSFVDVRDAATTFVAALEQGRAGERYLLGAANMPFSELFGRLSRLADVPPPRMRLPSELKVWSAEGLARLARWRGHEPALDRASVEMGEHFFYIDSEKAKDELGFSPRDPQETLRDTVRDLRSRRGPAMPSRSEQRRG